MMFSLFEKIFKNFLLFFKNFQGKIPSGGKTSFLISEILKRFQIFFIKKFFMGGKEHRLTSPLLHTGKLKWLLYIN